MAAVMQLVCSVATVEAIVRLAQRVPVFPCRRTPEELTVRGKPKLYGPKTPLTPNGLHDATQDPERIRAWWRQWPDALVGVPTGSVTGLFVLDYDAHKVDEASREWVAGNTDLLLTTRAHETLNGGRHYLYRITPGALYRSGTNVLLGNQKRVGIDVRAEGGYIIWWPMHGAQASGELALLPAGLADQLRIEKRELPALPTASPQAWAKDRPRLVDALAYCDPADYGAWFRTGMAIHLASGGSEEGFALWHDWSAGGITGDVPVSYSGREDCRYHWDTFLHDKDRRGTVTIASVFHAAKAGGWQRMAPAPEPPPMEFAPVEAYEDEARGYDDSPPAAPEPAPSVIITLSGFTAAQLMAPIEPEKYLVPGMVPTEAYTLIAGSLSAAKTTFLHCLILWRATGYDVLDLGGAKGTGIDTGPCVLVSYEDSDNRIVKRFQRLVQHQFEIVSRMHGRRAAGEYLQRVEKNIRRMTLTGQRNAGLVMRREGAIMENTPQIDAILAGVRAFAGSEVMLGIDPLRLAIVGSQNDDDGADVVVHVLNRLAAALPDSGVVIPSHTTKSQAKEGGTGMADAAYATSGSALYSQHARSNFHLSRLSSEAMRSEFPPGTFSDEEIAKQLATCLTHGRLSHGAEGDQKCFAMRGGVLEPAVKQTEMRGIGDKASAFLPHVRDAIERIVMGGGRPSQKALESDAELERLIGGRNRLRDFLRLAIDQEWIEAAGSTNTRRLVLTDRGLALAGSEWRESDGGRNAGR